MNWAAFCSYVLLTAITPGPNTIMSMSNAAKYGFKRAFPFNVGVLLGFLVVMGLCAAFSSLLYEFIPAVKPYMLVLGAKEAEAGNISVRDRKGETTTQELDAFINNIVTEIKERRYN